MRMLVCALLPLALHFVAPLALGADDAKERDLAVLQGTWRPVSMEMDGKFLPAAQLKKVRLTITGEKFTFDTGDDSHDGLYKINPETDPKQLDIVITRGDEKGKVYLVIYKFEDGRMIQCMQTSNKQRPNEFSGKSGTGNLYEIWERADEKAQNVTPADSK